MKIVNIVPGFGGTFYCGNCLRDSAFVASLRQAGHDASILPMYLPLQVGINTPDKDIPVFYGAVNIYLKQQFPFMRNMPSWLEKFFNSTPILKFAASKSSSTRATGLEEMTESMLLGKNGNQSHELQQLVDFLKHHEKPDIVHFSNALLLGMAEQIRNELNVPVVFSLQDEDVWVDVMSEKYKQRIWDLMAEKAAVVDAFIPVSNYFASVMKTKMRIPDAKLHILPIGIDPGKYQFSEPAKEPRAIGYLSRICEENGFGILVDAFIILKKDLRFKDLKLRVTGGKTGDDDHFISEQYRKLRENSISHDVEIFPEFTLEHLHKFFKSITLLSVPVLNGEAFGLYQLEALASGIPLVQPRLGAFPEIIESTGGGMIYESNTPQALSEALAEVLDSPSLLMQFSKSGHEAVLDTYDCRKVTLQMISIYQGLLNKRI
ncbi:MAG: glycosyltransferase family 4 protein [Bacteroidetes bacterium]|nr:glycosyltransferase family 4 protein [Bacteroidota bacterium]